MEKFNLSFNKFEIQGKLDKNIICSELRKRKYSETEGWGFSDVDCVDSLVTAKLLKSVTAYYRIWNASTAEMERQYYNMVKEIRMYLDFDRMLIAVEGNTADMNKLKQVFRSVFWRGFVYEPLKISPFGVLEIADNDQKLSCIDELTISDFNFNNIFLGKYVAKPANGQILLKDVIPYKENLAKVKIKIVVDEYHLKIAAGKSGTITVECDEDVKYSFFKYLTSKLY